jgi:hypothetical protein
MGRAGKKYRRKDCGKISDISFSNRHKTKQYQKTKGGRTPTASRYETKDASCFIHNSDLSLHLITSSLVDDMTSSSEEDILMYMWLKLCKRKKRKWIHDFNESCAQHGVYVLAHDHY